MGHTASVKCLALGHKSGRVMVTGGDDKKVNMWAVGKPNCIMVGSQRVHFYVTVSKLSVRSVHSEKGECESDTTTVSVTSTRSLRVCSWEVVPHITLAMKPLVSHRSHGDPIPLPHGHFGPPPQPPPPPPYAPVKICSLGNPPQPPHGPV